MTRLNYFDCKKDSRQCLARGVVLKCLLFNPFIMNDVTLLVIRFLGPIYLAVGVGFLLNQNYYEEMYKKVKGEPFMLLVTGMASMALGLAILNSHNTWTTFSEVLVSVIGWGALVKGAWISVCPKSVLKLSDKIMRKGLIAFSGGFALLIGAGLTWLGFLA
jgi:uncharacterized protein YjeT (DUF2065 family)